MSPPSSRLNSRSSEKPGSAWQLLLAGILLGLFFDPEDEGDMFLRNVGYKIGHIIIKYNYNEQVKENAMGNTCSTHGEKRNAYRGEPEEKRPPRRPRRR
jgi:hypothetical protein